LGIDLCSDARLRFVRLLFGAQSQLQTTLKQEFTGYVFGERLNYTSNGLSFQPALERRVAVAGVSQAGSVSVFRGGFANFTT